MERRKREKRKEKKKKGETRVWPGREINFDS